MAIFTTIFSLLGNLVNPISDYIKHKSDMVRIERETEMKIALERQQLAAELAKNDSKRAEVALASTGKWFKYAVFWLISSPFISCLIGQPWYAEQVFNNLSVLPEWYAVLYSGLVMVIFGIPVPGSIAGNIWAGIKQANQNRRDYKIKKLEKKTIYEAIRKGQGYVSQSLVDHLDPVLDEHNKKG